MAEPRYRIIDRPYPGSVRVIDEEGGQVGIIDVSAALEMAEERDLDLVELDPNSVPPTCKLMNFGRFRYLQRKKVRQQKKNLPKRKEIKLRPKTDEHDFQVKVRKVREFLEQGHKVLVTLVFRGREQRHPEIGFDLLQRFYTQLEDVAKVEKEPSREGSNRLGMILAKK